MSNETLLSWNFRSLSWNFRSKTGYFQNTAATIGDDRVFPIDGVGCHLLQRSIQLGKHEMMPLDLPANSATSETMYEKKLADAEQEIDIFETRTLSASFCETHALAAKRYAMSIVHRWSDVEEIVQEAFCRLVESSKTQLEFADGQNNVAPGTTNHIKTESSQKAMLFAIVRNLSIDLLRKNGRRKFEVIDTELVPNSKKQTDSAELERLELSVQDILKQMSDQWSDALQLKVNGGLSYDEIAKVLNATHGQVRTWIFRARKTLASELTRLGLLDGDLGGDKHE